jgi:CheY-like chemotaxis protein
MRLKIIQPPTGEIPGVGLDRFEVGHTYEVGTQVSGVLIAEGWAEIVADDSTRRGAVLDPLAADQAAIVLVVDDEPAVQRLTQMLLALNGYRVVLARHGREALNLLQEHCPDLVVLDLNMPVMNGWQFCAEQRHLAPRLAAVPVVVMSGEVDAPEHAAALQVDGLVQKPFNADALLGAVRRAIRR